MADNRNRTPFYGAVPTSSMRADHVFMADGSTLQEQADKKFELIEEITLTEATTVIERETEPGGAAYNFSKILVEILIPVGTLTNELLWCDFNTYRLSRQNQITTTSYPVYVNAYCEVNNGLLFSRLISALNTLYNSITEVPTPASLGRYSGDAVEGFKLSFNSLASFPVDTNIKIYAVRA